MSTSPNSSTPPKTTESHHEVSTGTSRTRVVLVALLLLLAIALPVSRHLLYSRPSPPPKGAKLAALMKYYSDRISSDPSDIDAYVSLGKLDEAAGYYTDALRRLYSARALGAKEQDYTLSLGRSLMFLGHYDDAGKEMEKAVQLMPNNVKAVCALADVFEAQDRRTEASKVISTYVSHHPELAAAHPGDKADILSQLEHLLQHALSDDNKELALQLASDLMTIAPDHADGFSVTGQMLVTDKQYARGLEMLQKAAVLAPRDGSIQYSMGLALNALGKDSDALNSWQKALSLDPRSNKACYRLAEAFDRKHDYPHCAMALQTIALADISNAGAASATAFAFDKCHDPVAAAYWRSVAAGDKKDYQNQLKFGLIASKDPTWHRRSLGTMAAAYHGLNKMKEYLVTVQEEAAGGTAEDDVSMANAYGATDHLDDQNRMLKRALTKNPKNPGSIYLSLSRVAGRQGLRDEAEADLEKAISIQPDIPGYHAALGALYMERRSEAGRLAKAIDEFKKLIKLDPYEPDGYQQLGIAYAAQGDLRRAAHSLEHALDLLPGDGSTFQELARVYARMGEKSESEKMFALYKKYVAFDLQKRNLQTQSRARSKDPAAQFALGEFLENSGNFSDALQYYRLASSLHPGDSAIKAKVEQISRQLGLAAE